MTRMAIHFGGFNLDNDIDCYGFRKDDDFDEVQYGKFMEFYRPVLARRLKRWEKYLPASAFSKNQTTTAVLKKRFSKDTLMRFIRKGIPASFRPRVWMAISGAEQAMLPNSGTYEAYSCSKLPADVTESIELDLDRTFPDNNHFRSTYGRLALKQVLRALAAKRPHVGYCQGFNFIVGMLILILNSPERAFWLMDAVLDRFPEDYYGSNLKGVRVDIRVLELLIVQSNPEIDALFRRLDVNFALLTTKWFICWFLENLPIETVLRLWDCLFSDYGMDVLIRAAYTIVTRNRQRIMKCTSFQRVVEIFQKMFVEDQFALDCHSFVHEMFESTKWLKANRLDELRRRVISTNDY